MPHTKYSFLSYQRFRPASSLGTHVLVVLASSTCLRLCQRVSHQFSVTTLCRLPACSIVGLNGPVVSLQFCWTVCQDIAFGGRIALSVQPRGRNFSCSIHASIAYSRTLRCFILLYRPSGFPLSVSSLSAKYLRRACFRISTLRYTVDRLHASF